MFGQVVTIPWRIVGNYGRKIGNKDITFANLLKHLSIYIPLAHTLTSVLINEQVNAISFQLILCPLQCGIDNRFGVLAIILP